MSYALDRVSQSDPLTHSEGLRQQNYIRDDIKTLLACFTELVFAPMNQMQQEAKQLGFQGE